jgi:hypothetical protein
VSVHFLETFCPPRSWNTKFGTRKSEEKLCWSENNAQASVCPFPVKNLEEQPKYRNCPSLCSLCEGKEGAERIYICRLFSLITGNKTSMMLIIFLGLIGKLMSVSGYCDVGTRDVKNFNWDKVCIPETSSFYFFFSIFIFHLWFH